VAKTLIGRLTKAQCFPGKALEQRDSDDIYLGETSSPGPETAESSSAPAAKGKGKGAKQRSKGQASKATTPHARTKKAVQPSESATSSVEAGAVAPSMPAAAATPAPPAAQAPAMAAVAAVAPAAAETKTVARSLSKKTRAVPATGQDTASDAMGRMTLSPLQTQPEKCLPMAAAPSPAPSQKNALVFPPSPKTIQELPHTLSDLEALLPKFDMPPVDSVEQDDEDEIAALALADKPDFIKYILCNIRIIHTHRKPINQHEHAALWTQLQERKLLLDWYFLHYSQLRLGKGMYRKNTQPEVDPIFGPFDDMDVDLPEAAPISK
jgi:hypothetical protein